MTRPFLSIVTISFNQAPYLRQCVDSVVSQKGDDVEYIVVDPGSTDGTREILAGYGDAIDHLVLEPDEGPADGLNKGFAKAVGKVGYLINSDDFMLSGAIERMRRLWRENPSIDLLLGGAWMVDGESEPLREVFPNQLSLEGLLSGSSTMVQHGLSFRMDLFRAAGGFNLANRTCWDYELLCDMMGQAPKTLITNEKFGVFRLHDTSRSGGGHGDTHEHRYHADLDRINANHEGRVRKQSHSLLAKLAANPVWSAKVLADRLLICRRRNRWHADLTQ